MRAHHMGIVYSEESRLLKPGAIRTHGSTVAFCTLRAGKFTPSVVRVDELNRHVIAAQVNGDPETSYYLTQSTLRPNARSRRLSSVLLLNATWVDIDLAHPGEEWSNQYKAPGGDVKSLAALLIRQLIDAGLPAPTYVVATGGGLCPKWLFKEPVPVTARARWSTVQKRLLDVVEKIVVGPGVRWPVDRSASDAARILRLVGTVNPRWGAPCWVCWDGGKEYDFDDLADGVLPYTRAEVAAWREASRSWREWDKSRARAAGVGLRRSSGTRGGQQATIEDLIVDEAGRGLWTARFEFGRAVLADRGGAAVGNRNNHFWPLATALAWSCGGGGIETQLRRDLAALHQDLFRGSDWTQVEAISAAGSVIKRLGQPVGVGTGNYKFKTSTWLEQLGVTPRELEEHGHLLGGGARGARKNVGAMGFKPMKGMDFDAWLAETKRRQVASGTWSAATRKTTYPSALREQAEEMKKKGCSQQEIAATLSVSQQTISRWLKS